MIIESIRQRLDFALNAFASLSALEQDLAAAAETIVQCLQRGGTVFACGNGGSAAEAQHFTTELIGRFRSNRISLPAIALNADGTALTCIANDFGWEAVFARQVEGLARPCDLLVCFSTSGESPNIIAALQAARARGIESIAVLGRDGGRARAQAAQAIVCPGADTASIQETQLWCIHALCEAVEEAYPARTTGSRSPHEQTSGTRAQDGLITIIA